ncbi:17957_t:CDS:1, partial [Gigaspora rosea]
MPFSVFRLSSRFQKPYFSPEASPFTRGFSFRQGFRLSSDSGFVTRHLHKTPNNYTPNTEGKNLMSLITEEEIKRQPDDRTRLIDKNNKDCIKAGDVLMIETYTNKGSNTVSTFAGVCISIRRQGIDTNLTLRNVILKVGIEQRFSIYSPMIKSIKILQRGEGFRRAKLFYLRDQPGKAFQIGGL